MAKVYIGGDERTKRAFFLFGMAPNKTIQVKEWDDSSLSGRLINNKYSQEPAYNATVQIGDNADIYGCTYFKGSLPAGNTTIRAYYKGKSIEESVSTSSGNMTITNITFNEATTGNPPTVEETDDHLKFTWTGNNCVELSLKLSNTWIEGIGGVYVNGIPIKTSSNTNRNFRVRTYDNPGLTWDTTASSQYTSYEIDGKYAIVHSILVTGATQDSTTDVDWIFAPFERTVSSCRDSTDYYGVGYRFSVSGSDFNISELRYDCSWELWEDVHIKESGTTHLSRRRSQFWIHEPITGSLNMNNTLGLHHLQPPDYIFDLSGSLSTYIWPPAEMGDNLVKSENSGYITYQDTHKLGDVTTAELPFRVILYSTTGSIDKYTYLMDELAGNYRDFYGLEYTVINPAVLISDVLSHTFGTGWDFTTVTDDYMASFQNWNFKRVLVLFPWESDASQGGDYPNRVTTPHNIVMHSNDASNFTTFINDIHSKGMTIQTWIPTHYSISSSLWWPPTPASHNWWSYDEDGDPRDIVAGGSRKMEVNYRTTYPKYALDKLKTAQTTYHISSIYFDAYGAAHNTDYNHTPIVPHIDQLGQYISEIQDMGYDLYLESVSPFAVISVGSLTSAPGGDIGAAFSGQEWLLYDTHIGMNRASDDYPLDFNYYRCLANKATIQLRFTNCTSDELALISSSNYDYNEMSTFMDTRTLYDHPTSGEKIGVLWDDDETTTQVLFAFSAMKYTLEGGRTTVYDVTNRVDISDTVAGGQFTTSSQNTYKITD